MGCCCCGGKSFRVNNIYPGQDSSAVRDFTLIGLNASEINRFYKAFCKFDVIGDGLIELAEFTSQLKLGASDKIAKEVFNDMDRNGDGDLNFREFVLCIWKYLMRTKESVALFAFDMFDTDNSGSLSREEISAMISFVYGTSDLNKHVQKIIQDIDCSGDGRISKQEFISSVKKFPALLFPAFEMQNILRANVLGDDFWERKGRTAETILAKEEVQKLFAKPASKKGRKPTDVHASGHGHGSSTGVTAGVHVSGSGSGSMRAHEKRLSHDKSHPPSGGGKHGSGGASGGGDIDRDGDNDGADGDLSDDAADELIEEEEEQRKHKKKDSSSRKKKKGKKEKKSSKRVAPIDGDITNSGTMLTKYQCIRKRRNPSGNKPRVTVSNVDLSSFHKFLSLTGVLGAERLRQLEIYGADKMAQLISLVLCFGEGGEGVGCVVLVGLDESVVWVSLAEAKSTPPPSPMSNPPALDYCPPFMINILHSPYSVHTIIGLCHLQSPFTTPLSSKVIKKKKFANLQIRPLLTQAIGHASPVQSIHGKS
eukprot:gene1246-2417_t